MIRTMLAAVTGMLWCSNMLAAQSPSQPQGEQQRAGVFHEFILRGLVDEEISVADTPHASSAPVVNHARRRQRDSVWNGVLIGAGAGALAGFALGRSADSPTCPRSGSECGQGALIGTVGGAFWGAVGGWITDALIHKKEASPTKIGVVN